MNDSPRKPSVGKATDPLVTGTGTGSSWWLYAGGGNRVNGSMHPVHTNVELSYPPHTSCRLPNVPSSVRHEAEGRTYREGKATGCVTCPMGLCGPKVLESKAAVPGIFRRNDKAKA